MRLLLVLVSLAAVLAGCAGNDTDTTPDVSPEQAVVQETAQKTLDATPAKVAGSGSVKGGTTKSSRLETEGAIDHESGHMTLTTTEGGETTTTEIIHSGTVFYLKPPEGTAIPQGKTWIKIDVAEYSPGTSDMTGFLQFLQADPLRILEFVSAGITSVEEVGPADVRGEPTTHYKGIVNNQKGAEGSSDLSDAFTGLASSASFTEFPVELWIDDDGVCRKITYELPVPGTRGGGVATSTIELYDFGSEADITIPADDDAYDYGEALNPTTTGGEPR